MISGENGIMEIIKKVLKDKGIEVKGKTKEQLIEVIENINSGLLKVENDEENIDNNSDSNS
jgi:hypothetical protein